MDSDYDRKFAEMKSYIPFLERMIKRLENTSTTSGNPRQAQLDKIRSLRDLLLDKKKRMKMENLLKCEQVLLNLYYKVEQKDTLPGIQKASEIITPLQMPEKTTSREKLDLQVARNKLLKVQEAQPETLPEIARANETQMDCTAGSKEPALFQRRPHINSKSPKPSPIKSPRSSSAKRSYTRVLVSPDSRERRWTTTEDETENTLFSRRSPRRYSPSYHKRERKKYTKESKSRHRQDLNITLKVPEESLNSLNTEDILSRIINCSSNDVNIDTLRELRNQILGELKQTGVKDDISDLILKSYKHKKKVSKSREEVEEGELSDSESEAIENIYGSVVIMEKDKKNEYTDKSGSISVEKDNESRKIQICLVINSDKDKNINADETENSNQVIENIADTSDFEMYKNKPDNNGATEILTGKASVTETIKKVLERNQSGMESNQPGQHITKKQNQIDTTPNKDVIVIEDLDDEEEKDKSPKNVTRTEHSSESNITVNEIVSDSDGKGPEFDQIVEVNKDIKEDRQNITKETLSEQHRDNITAQPFLPYFYKPLSEQSNLDLSINASSEDKNKTEVNNKSDDNTLKPNKEFISNVQEVTNIISKDNYDRTNKKQESTDIPFLNLESDVPRSPKKNDIVSEIDILQALKNEILSDSIAIPGTEVVTPPLHVPKITKVASAQEILPKKRISIEKYKEKVISSPRHTPSWFIIKDHIYQKEDVFQKEDFSKKQSLKLTAKECVRFSFINKFALDDISDEDDNDEIKLNNVEVDETYGDLAPKSPDINIPVDETTSPVIIPTDPVKTVSKNACTDVDMRKLPMLSPNNINQFPNSIDNISTSSINKDTIGDVTNMEIKAISSNITKDTVRLKDPRVRRDLKKPSNIESSKIYGTTADRSPVVTMSALNATPYVRSYEVTPHISIETDEHSSSQMTGAPIFQNHDGKETSVTSERRKSRWNSDDQDQNDSRKWESRDPRTSQNSSYSDVNQIRNRMDIQDVNLECPPTPSHYFGRSDCPPTPTPSFGRLEPPPSLMSIFMRPECPLTPSHPFGMAEGPTVVSSFGISECPPIPSHAFGWSDCPSTPNHSFGMSDCPSTPSHPFGRHEAPRTPIHPLGRSDYTQSQSYSSQKFAKSGGRQQDPRLHRNLEDDDRECFYKDRNNRLYNNSDSYRNYKRESIGRDDRGKDYRWRESTVGRGMSKEYDDDHLYTRDRRRENCYENERSVKEVGSRRGYQHEKPTGLVRTTHSENNPYRYRAASVGRTSKDNVNDDTLSVKQNFGRSFTIDTSVNTTFQRDIDINRRDVRRQRATSVGRCLLRESSVERTTEKSSLKNSNSVNNFRRSHSLGREIVDSNKPEKSLKDIKADFEAFRSKFNKKQEKGEFRFDKTIGKSSLKDMYDVHTSLEKNSFKYSPRKNYRDPRMRREQGDSKYNKYNKYRYDFHEKKKYGMVYSSDNIAKGAILGAGFGVKNYKIPKIKRVSDKTLEKIDDKNTENVKGNTLKEKQRKSDNQNYKNTESIKATEKGKDQGTDVNKQSKKSKPIKDSSGNLLKSDTVDSDSSVNSNSSKKGTKKSKDLNTDSDKMEKIVTRSSKKSSTLELENSISDTSVKAKKNRKAVVCDSDSDDNNKEVVTETLLLDKSSSDVNESLNLGNNNEKQVESLSSSYDLDIFSDSIAMDPVVNNINTLIEHLENDLDTPKVDISKLNKSSNFTQEISLEKMLENISSPENYPAEVKSGADNSVSSKPDLNVKCDESVLTNEEEASPPIESKETDIAACTNHPVQLQEVHNKNPFSQISQSMKPAGGASDVCSIGLRTQLEMEPSKTYKVQNSSENRNIEKDTDSSSIPDSTVNKMEETLPDKSIVEEKLLDNTHEDQSEMIDDVSSTHDTLFDDIANEENTDPSSPLKDPAPQVDMESFLSILQNKTKIKELLIALGDQTNDKIKKKLEKLSEIVSDDEDTKDEDTVQVESTTKGNEGDVAENETNDVIENKICGQEKDSEFDESNENDKLPHVIENYVQEKNEDFDESKENDNIAHVIESCVQEKNEVFDESKENDKTECGKAVQETDEERHETNENDEIEDQIEDEIEDTNMLEDSNEKKDVIENVVPATNKPAKKVPMKKGKKIKGKTIKKQVKRDKKRVTRSEAASARTKKKKTTELMKLQQDIKEMFIRDEVLNATGIRMCRLAKLDYNKDDSYISDDETANTQDIKRLSDEPPVTNKPLKKKTGPKPKTKISLNDLSEDVSKTPKMLPKYKPGPKSKTRKSDPYAFDCDSDSETIQTKVSNNVSSDSENDSTASSLSDGPSETAVEVKAKPKRKRRGWQAGVIKARNRKKKVEVKESEEKSTLLPDNIPVSKIQVPDLNCFTDKSYCFLKNVTSYACRLCEYKDDNIVSHYKKDHPHCEIPLSRMESEMAKEAIEQCEDPNFHIIRKMATEKYVCRFCFAEFSRRKDTLEQFFWHIVSKHTGEYKQLCSECVNVSRCPFNLDIPPPPKSNVKGQLIGFICGKCYFTQLSLENIKTHVIVRHNHEQTEVFKINLSIMSKKKMIELALRAEKTPRVLRSSRSNQSLTEPCDSRSDITESSDYTTETGSARNKPDKSRRISSTESLTKPVKSKLRFETDDSASEISSVIHPENDERTEVKLENIEYTLVDNKSRADDVRSMEEPTPISNDINDSVHFKIRYAKSGIKEYVCCINGEDNHYKTSLLISMKKHIQTKHSEKWDGYCYICKVIVTTQGAHNFRECLQHYLDKHMDNFPEIKDVDPGDKQIPAPEVGQKEIAPRPPPPTGFINVRPFSELMSKPIEDKQISSVNLPIIESVVSLGIPDEDQTYDYVSTTPEVKTEQKYEETQATVMTNKHSVVLQTMMARDKLVHIFKCAGRYCSFTSDSPEKALLHASRHQIIGGMDCLNCAYCEFDSSGNAIDLVSHVFKEHGMWHYVCGRCFYRAASSQLVDAHFSRKHLGETSSILRSTSAAMSADVDTSGMLTRDAAVPFYVCCHGKEQDDSCKFRTYIPGKFMEHLVQKHLTANAFFCYICSASTPSPMDLLKHMNSHDLKLYQCTYCVHGAYNEATMLSHASAKHPAKLPQAYVRIVTAKDGSTEYKVLPLARLNKVDIHVQTVAPCTTNENPTREAERSIELEKLIGHTNLMIESMVSDVAQAMTKELDIDVPEIQNIQPITDMDPSPVLTTLLSLPQKAVSLSQKLAQTVTSEQASPNTISSSQVICLDSDEEDSKEGIIAIKPPPTEPTPSVVQPPTTVVERPSVALQPSPIIEKPNPAVGESPIMDTSTGTKTLKKVPMRYLFKCSRCMVIFRVVNTFNSHLSFCFPGGMIRCCHCDYMTMDKDDICKHYLEHTASDRYVCGVCSYPAAGKIVTLPSVKKHMKNIHSVTSTRVCLTMIEDRVEYTVRPVIPEPHSRPKRKLSGTPAVTPEKKRYSPQDVDSLPTKPILDEEVFCTLCEFHTKVRHNMVRHLQLHAEQQPVPQTAPINPVPHLQTNEKHFDKMVNLASSSLVSKSAEKLKDSIIVHIPPEAASSFPKYVEDRLRFACGAKGCTYITVDEDTLRHHWDTLHSNVSHFLCVHCPPNQHLDTSRPLTAARIITHLKMHDVSLYACSCCTFYYHYKLNVVEKHVAENHNACRILIVREEGTVTSSASNQASGAPTMDLKSWQCGVCQFNNMLRQNVVDHCAKIHQSKMQYKCMYCPYRTSTPENITKHQASSHSDKAPEIFYFYYKDGSVPNEPDGTPRWIKQRQKNPDPSVKTETEAVDTPTLPNIPPVATPAVDLNLVKLEVIDKTGELELSVDELCEIYGQFCEPNGIKYKCPLCSVVSEDNSETMQSHLFEELQYRKWGCNLCFYKAFHKKGLNDHMNMEHSRQRVSPIEQPTDLNIEKWVQNLLDHQTKIIQENKQKLVLQKVQTERSVPSTSQDLNKSNTIDARTFNENELIKAFGQFGTPTKNRFRCPKCEFLYVNESDMQNHLEIELSRIRWCCNTCSDHFQTYHEAQFHCKSVHTAGPSRPVEAIRDPASRTAWIVTCTASQKQILTTTQETESQKQIQERATAETEFVQVGDSNEDSLLVVRYEEPVPVLEVQAHTEAKSQTQSDRKRPASDSDEDFLTIDEDVDSPKPQTKKTPPMHHCPHCDFSTKYSKAINEHIYRHYNLKPFTCHICNFLAYRNNMVAHLANKHGQKLKDFNRTPMPTGPPTNLLLTQPKKSQDKLEEELNYICLVCEKRISEVERDTHSHDNTAPAFAKIGEIVIKCCICFTLVKDMTALQEHNNLHPNVPPNYSYYKMHAGKRDNYLCKHCNKCFSYIRDLRSHHEAFHKNQHLRYDIRHLSATPCTSGVIDLDEDFTAKRKAKGDLPPCKRVARKSTSKLPKEMSVARKSTTKLPFLHIESESDDEYTYYGTKAISLDEYTNVTMALPVLNKMVTMTMPKVSKILDPSPRVILKDLKHCKGVPGPSD